MDKKNLLSIGEMSKFTGASIHSLRYYERIGVLTPAFTDPDTGYRYYNFDQIHLLDFIGFCIEMDIPLKELHKFTGAGDVMDTRAFLAEGKGIAIKKLSAIKRGLRLIKEMERQMDIAEAHPPGQIYTRFVPEKMYYVRKLKACPKDMADIAREFLEMPYINDKDYPHLPEYGILAYHTPVGREYYVFYEIGGKPAAPEDENIKTIPAGEYFCILSQHSQTENAHEIFRGHLSGESSFIAIETEIFVAKYKIYEPMHEIRVLVI